MTNEQTNPKIWGPPLWKILHTITFKYPRKITLTNPKDVETRDKIKKIFTELKKTIPCEQCRESYTHFFNQLPITPYLTGRDKLTYWLYKIHNKVNAKLRKQELERYNNALFNLEIYSATNRIPPNQYNKIKNKLRKTILITKSDPTFKEVKYKYRNVS